MKKLTLAISTIILCSSSAMADQVFNDDVIVRGSECVGVDCSNGESFGFDTLRLKENNLRIKFQDTSTSASFPSNDWQLTANDSSNGGANKFSIDDIDGGRTPFTIEAGARNNALVVEADGDIGIGTLNPAVDLHVVTGNTPTLRLDQDGSSGFTPQIWDIAGNEANFFVRDVTNGSELPFKIKPGADTSSIFIAADNDIGFGTENPAGVFHILRSGNVLTYVQSSSNEAVQMRMRTDNTNRRLIAVDSGDNQQSQINFGDSEIQFGGPTLVGANLYATINSTGTTLAGNLEVAGTVTVGGTQVHPDYVFEPDYKLMPLAKLKSFVNENKHLPEIPSATDVAENGLNMTEMQIKLLKKVEELTLYTLKQQDTIDKLKDKLAELDITTP